MTFFMRGGWVDSYPDDVKMILSEGHDLGNHSQNHKNMSKLSDSDKEKELISVHEKVKTLTGYDMFLFRPPYGDYGVDSTIKTVTEHKHLGNGSIILCHNGAKYTAEALDTLITTLKDAGYTFVPLSQLIYRDKYHMDHEGRQIPN